MATEFKLPELGEDIESGEILRILAEVGDSVTQNKPVIEIKTNKIASIEILAPVSGIVKEIHVEKAKKVKPGQLVLTIDESGVEKEGKSEDETNAIRQ